MGYGPWALSFQEPAIIKAAAFVDGFNLYHSICDLGDDHLKWLDLRKLCLTFLPESQYDLVAVYYFSAYATWRAPAYRRHRAYVAALKGQGVRPIMGKFKEKQRRCRNCQTRWKSHEEKETDVNIALLLLDGANRDEYDRALLVTGDSDLAPAVRMVKQRFPAKSLRVLTPVGRHPSSELLQASGERGTRLERLHLERALLPATVVDSAGAVVATRPSEYGPPP